ncbi:MAG: chemotaxis protein CheX [Thermoguttaceae bacterium]|jgi:chemotaxis protein CheX|nr:chemotaxis protein CheX [Thermoguttaceae bacterium]
MTVAASCASATGFVADPVLLKAIVHGVDSALVMCNTAVRCVGVSAIPSRDPGSVTGLIGVHGEVSGFITVNMSEKMAVSLVSGLLQDQFTALSHEILDGVGEITNILAGGVKNALTNTPWGFRHVTVPSVIVGQNYQIAYAKGLQYLAATFEQQGPSPLLFADRILQVAISLIKL